MRGVVKGAADAVKAAMDAGDALILAKEKVGHGDWMLWLEKNCALSDRTARVYMQLAQGREIIEAQIKAATEMAVDCHFALGVSANFTITKALDFLRRDRENVVSTSTGGRATIGPKKKREKLYFADETPEHHLDDWLNPELATRQDH
jgi:hypothetical protein